MLRPIVEAAGYLVIGDGDELMPDLVIAVRRRRDRAPTGGAHVLTLATDPDGADGEDSIYRYDRAGLLLGAASPPARGGADERIAADRDDRRKPRRLPRRPRSKAWSNSTR